MRILGWQCILLHACQHAVCATLCCSAVVQEARIVCAELGLAGGAVIGTDKRSKPVVQVLCSASSCSTIRTM